MISAFVSENRRPLVVMRLGSIVEQGSCERWLRTRVKITPKCCWPRCEHDAPMRSPVSGAVVLQPRIVQDLRRRSLSSRRRGSSTRSATFLLTVRRGETLGIVRIRLRQVDGGALRRAAGEADQRRDPDRQRRTSCRSGRRNSAPCGGGCNSCFRILTGRSIRAARSAKPSSRGR